MTTTYSYGDMERLAAASEKAGGYAHISGGETDAIEVIDTDAAGKDRRTRLEGRQAFSFLQHLLRRSQAREAELQGAEDYDKASIEQAQRDARREVLAQVTEAVERFR